MMNRQVLGVGLIGLALITEASAQKVITVLPPGVAPPPQAVQQPQTPLNPSATACLAESYGLIPQGTRVLGASVGFTHAVQNGEIQFYQVIVQLGIGDQQFSYKFQCRVWGKAVQIMRREVVN